MKTKFRHRLVYIFFRPFFKVFLRWRFNFQYERFDEKKLPGPYLIIGNHTQNLDPIFLAMSFQKPIYFVASTMVFNLPVISPLLKYLAAPIPIDKFRSDVKSAKMMLKTLKNGSHVSVFPEGNTSYSGKTGPMDISIAKLAKTAKVPLVFYNLEGGYLTRPRWALYHRKGLLKGGVKKVLMPDEINDMSVEELHQEIIQQLTVNDYEVMKNHRYIGKYKAAGAETGFYYCPHCQAFETLVSDLETIYCQTCEFKVDINDHGKFEKLFNGHYFDTPMPWMEAQEAALKVKIHQATDQEILFQDDALQLFLIRPLKSKKKIGTVDLFVTKKQLMMKGLESEYTFSHLDIQVAVQMRNNLIVHDKKTNQTLYLVPKKTGNTLKYIKTVECVQNGGM